ncbi:hypothetical protein [Flammeovirga sp. OC4]|uniref:hypothetical protein n=1 Tax=Flammeovirga sp. OC4 TaxID=1382345 RepID=UPI0012E02894|nr:hypothetical protein [Flammeovirga sp. OC4]
MRAILIFNVASVKPIGVTCDSFWGKSPDFERNGYYSFCISKSGDFANYVFQVTLSLNT